MRKRRNLLRNQLGGVMREGYTLHIRKIWRKFFCGVMREGYTLHIRKIWRKLLGGVMRDVYIPCITLPNHLCYPHYTT